MTFNLEHVIMLIKAYQILTTNCFVAWLTYRDYIKPSMSECFEATLG